MHQIDFDKLRRHARYYALLTLVPFLLWFVGAWSNAAGFLLTLFVLPAIYLIAVVTTCYWSFAAWRGGEAETPWRWRFGVALFPMVLFGLSLLFFSPLAKAGDMAGALTRLAINHHRAALLGHQILGIFQPKADQGITRALTRAAAAKAQGVRLEQAQGLFVIQAVQ